MDTFEEEAEIDLMAVRKEREQLKAELASLEIQMAAYLKELGYGISHAKPARADCSCPNVHGQAAGTEFLLYETEDGAHGGMPLRGRLRRGSGLDG